MDPMHPPTGKQIGENEAYLPVANILRVMRRGLPENAKISKEAKETMQECVTEFIGFVTDEAKEKCEQDRRRTVTTKDILWAMENLGFDDYVQVLALYQQRLLAAAEETRQLSLPPVAGTSGTPDTDPSTT
mmetsp:Transcript_1073/g.2827  ORF Transcript_1073/g.2827 Transcript_1073/m.2827 type:complete len:131 (+) Transcript_1073:105-497(+)